MATDDDAHHAFLVGNEQDHGDEVLKVKKKKKDGEASTRACRRTDCWSINKRPTDGGTTGKR